MNWITERIIAFFIDNFPSWKAILFGCPPGILWSYVCLFFAGYLKKHKRLKTGYTRKIFHFLIFTSVAIIQLIWDTSIVCLFGGMCTIVIFYAIIRGRGNILYEAMAREKDEPRRTHYIIVAYFATLIGGIVSNVLFGTIALIGYLVAGLGDAVGEPVGLMFGKHIYKVPSLTTVKTIRSLEGSAAVFIVSLVAIASGILLSPELIFNSHSVIMILLLGLACTLTEAISPHGWDNITMQVIPAFLASLLFSI